MSKPESKTEEIPNRALVVRDTPGNRSALVSRFGQDDFGTALTVQQFIGISNAYGLNPFMNQIVPFHGRPYIQFHCLIHFFHP